MLPTKSPVVGQDDEFRQGDAKLVTLSRSYSSVVSGTVLHVFQLPHTPIHAKGFKFSPPESVESNRKYNMVIFGMSESHQGTLHFSQIED